MSTSPWPRLAACCLLLLGTKTLAISVPSNIQSLYTEIKAQGECNDKAATGFYASDDGPDTFSYCQDHLQDYGILYLQGTGGALADMDIDCDGNQDEPSSNANDGRCGNSGDTQSDTSFEDTVASYGESGLKNLNPYVHPYIVFGNSNDRGTSGYATFEPTKYGVEPLSLMAVVCNNQVIFGLWGDENGDDNGAKAMVGEAAISTATLCFGDSMTGNNGHAETDILYLAFTGTDAIPGAEGADWAATSAEEFESSLEALGTKLLQRIGSSGAANSTVIFSPSSTPSATTSTVLSSASALATSSCSWQGHCAGASCSTGDDCSDTLGCSNGKCASA